MRREPLHSVRENENTHIPASRHNPIAPNRCRTENPAHAPNHKPPHIALKNKIAPNHNALPVLGEINAHCVPISDNFPCFWRLLRCVKYPHDNEFSKKFAAQYLLAARRLFGRINLVLGSSQMSSQASQVQALSPEESTVASASNVLNIVFILLLFAIITIGMDVLDIESQLRQHFARNLRRLDMCRKEGFNCLLSVSGGVDSVAMGWLFHDYISSKRGLGSFSVCYIDHGFRKESVEECAFVRSLAQQEWGVDFHSETLSSSTSSSTSSSISSSTSSGGMQSDARKQRYACLLSLAKKGGFTHLATAHHVEDNVESVWIHLLRGSGVSGFSGIASLLRVNGEAGVRIVRPLHTMSKADLVRWMRGRERRWMEDSSNMDKRYLRNKIRQDMVFPHRDMWQARSSSISRTFERFNDARRIIEESVRHFLGRYLQEKADYCLLLLPPKMTEGERALVYECLRGRGGAFSLENIGKLSLGGGRWHEGYGLSYEAYKRLMLMWDLSHVGRYVETKAYRIGIGKRGVWIVRKGGKKTEEILSLAEIKGGIIGYHGRWVFDATYIACQSKIQACSFEAKEGEDEKAAYFDAKAMIFPIQVRSVGSGDRICPMGMRGHKRVRKVLAERGLWKGMGFFPSVWVDQRGVILWVVGYVRGEAARIRQDSEGVWYIRARKRT